MFQHEFTIGKPFAGPDAFIWTCHYSNDAPNDKLTIWENLPDLRNGKLARTMDQCCMEIYPDYYDNVTKLQPKIQDNSDFSMNFYFTSLDLRVLFFLIISWFKGTKLTIHITLIYCS